MEISFFGAANEVTGSCYVVKTDKARFLVDCGMFQGGRRLELHNRIPAAIQPKNLDAVILTHGHLDHCGRLPLLVASGYRGPIYATPGTIDIAIIILEDAASIQEHDTARENRKRIRAGLSRLEPLFDQRDVEHVVSQFKAVPYDKTFDLATGVSARFVEAGHILGSASVELFALEGSATKKVVFSGDLGQYNMPLMKDPSHIEDADVVLMESTYGDRDHRSIDDTVREFQEIIRDAIDHGGKVLIPVFAVGRVQLILYYLAQMFRDKLIPSMPIYLDSPMAIAASQTYLDYASDMDGEAKQLVKSGQLRRDLSSLVTVESAEESMRLNSVQGPCIILAGAGMCNAGRILHHLKHNLFSPKCYVVIVGYQARGSLGRMLVDKEPKVKIFGETIAVNAKVSGLGGFSAHGGQTDLLRWLAPMAISKPKIILTHGESQPMQELAYQIKKRYGVTVQMPKMFETIIV